MKIHKEGYSTLLVVILFLAAVNGIVRYFASNSYYLYEILLVASIGFFLFILQFFRSPKRTTIINDNHVICPADGKVVVIEETQEDEYFKEKRIQVSIFMSPTNVHINRYPINGIVKYFKYHPGKFLLAWNPKSSTDNERTTVVVENENNVQVLFRQIAGFVARRIITYCNEGDKAEQGKEYGFIKFGSRVDVLLPLDAKLNVNLEQKVVGGETILATI